jgi:methyl coenzyme M reductase subunit D
MLAENVIHIFIKILPHRKISASTTGKVKEVQ